MAKFGQIDDLAQSILNDPDKRLPYYGPHPSQNPDNIMRAPAYVWESAPFLWQNPQSEDEAPARETTDMLTEIRRRELERLGVQFSPWDRNKAGSN